MKASRRLTLMSAAVVTTLALAACGGSTDDAPDEGAGGTGGGEQASEEVSGEIQYAWWGGPVRNERTQAVIDLYEQAHPEVSVAGTTAEFGGYWENMTVQAAGSNLPCVPQMQNRAMADYADRGALLPLDDLVESGAIDVSNLPESVLDSGRGADGNLYMIPYGAAFGSVMVNTTDVQELGLELPPDGYDWEWFAEWLTDISEATGEPAIGGLGNQQDLLEAWLRSHGEDFYAEGELGFTEDSIAEYWEYTEGLTEAGVAETAEQTVEDAGLPVEQGDLAQNRKVVAVWPANGLGTVQGTLDEVAPGHELAVYPLPSGPEGLGNAFWLSGLSIAETCDNVSTAASFIDFFVNDEEAALAFQADNGATTNTANLEALLAGADLTEAKKSELEMYEYLADEGVAPTVYGRAYPAIFQQELTRYFQEVGFGNATIEDGAQRFFSEAQGLIG